MKYIKLFEKFETITGDRNDLSPTKTYIDDITPETKSILNKSKFKIGDYVKLLTDAAMLLVGGLNINQDEEGNGIYTSDLDKYKREKNQLIFEIVEAQIYTRGKKIELSFMLKRLNSNDFIGWITEQDLEIIEEYEVDARKYNL